MYIFCLRIFFQSSQKAKNLKNSNKINTNTNTYMYSTGKYNKYVAPHKINRSTNINKINISFDCTPTYSMIHVDDVVY